MSVPPITHCPGTLRGGFDSYCKALQGKLFFGKKVSHVLPYNSPLGDESMQTMFAENTKRISISGAQEKFSLIQVKNKLRLTEEGEQSTHILKPIPRVGKRSNQMPANEHLTMQIAAQVFGIETAQNAIIFFKDGAMAYITRRFDNRPDGGKWAQEDFAALAQRTAASYGEHYKYLGNYLELFQLLERYVPAYPVEALKLFKLILFNYLFSNGDAHYKNFSLIETKFGDFRLSPAYDLLNSRIHIDDQTFALEEGLLPKNLAKGKIRKQFRILAESASLPVKIIDSTFEFYSAKSERVEELIAASFLDARTKRSYLQAYQTRLKKFNS